MEPDAVGVFVGSSFSYMTARDWAKFGQLYLQDGVWRGEQLLPRRTSEVACPHKGDRCCVLTIIFLVVLFNVVRLFGFLFVV